MPRQVQSQPKAITKNSTEQRPRMLGEILARIRGANSPKERPAFFDGHTFIWIAGK